MNNISKQFYFIVFVFSFLSVIFFGVGCTKQRDGENVIRIGAVLSLSGPQAQFGQRMREGIEMAVSEFNTKSNSVRLKVIFEDSQTSPKVGLSAYQKLSAVENCSVVFGNGSFLGQAVAGAADSNSAPFVALGTSIPHLTEGRDRLIRVSYTAESTTTPLAKYVGKTHHRIAILSVEDEYGKVASAAFKRELPQSGSTIVFEESFPLQMSDVAILAKKCLDATPDAVVFCGYGPNLLPLIQRMKALGSGVKIYADVALADPTVYTDISKGVEGTITVCLPINAGIVSTANQRDFLNSYRAKHANVNPDMWTTLAYDAVRIVLAAIETNNFKTDDLKGNIARLREYPGVSGSIHFTESADSIVTMIISRISEGRLVPIEVKSGNADANIN